MKRVLLFLALLTTTALAATPRPLHVGLIIAETRQDHVTVNPWGIYQRQGFELALNGTKSVTWEIKDNSESALLAREKAAEFLKGDVDFIAGLSFSDQAMAVKQQTDAAGVPFLTVFGTSENLFDKSKTVFTMAVSDDAQAATLARYLAGFPAAHTSGVGLIVARNCEYCVDMEKSLKAALAKHGLHVSQYPDILKNRPVPHDYFKSLDPAKLLVILAYEVEGLSVVNSLAKSGYQGVLLGGDSWSTQTMQVAKNLGLLHSMCLVNPVPYDVTAGSTQNRKFVRDYQSKFGEAPTDVAALSYDAGTVILKVSAKCASADNRKHCVADTMAKLHFEGVSGRVQFSVHGKRVNTGLLLKSTTCAQLERTYGFH